MAKTFKFEIITPERKFFSGEVELVVVKTLSGEEGFMADHAWACKLLAENGSLHFRGTDGIEKTAQISGGFIDVKDSILVFTDKADWAE